MELVFEGSENLEELCARFCVHEEELVLENGRYLIPLSQKERNSVKQGMIRLQRESISTLAKRFGVPESILIAKNGKDAFFEGAIIVIPKCEGEKYVVRPMDTVEKIAKAFGVSEEHLKEHNSVETVYAGQLLLIPKSEQ